MKFKTSTRVSLLFSIFTFFIILILLVVLNIFIFISWEDKEIKELKETNQITDILSSSFKEIISEDIKKNNWNDTLKSLLDFDLFEEQEHHLKWYEDFFYNLYIKNNKIYLIYSENNKTYTPYNVTDYFNNQIKIIKIGIALLIILTFLSFFISKTIFVKIALKDIYSISEQLKNIDLNHIKKLNISLEKNDEINIIIDSLNDFIEQIKKNHESLKQFNSGVAHEFKTPLMVISSELEFLNLTTWNTEGIKRIEFQIKKLDDLLSNFLLLTQIENWKKIKKEKINLFNIINKNLENFKSIYSQKNIKVINKVWKDIELTTNKSFFQVIIKNILDNAFKYNKEDWVIKIEIINNRLIIWDTWNWIKKENIDKIWNNFYRENEFQKWYWVGLNLVKKISDILDLEINLKSEEWKWSEFSIKIDTDENNKK